MFLQHCQAALQNHGGLAITLFIGGLVGSLTHCIGMCGPFAFAQTAVRGSLKPGAGVLTRVRGAALMPYHLGRITTYIVMAVAAASFAGFFATADTHQSWAALLMVAAGAIFLVSAFPALKVTTLPPKLAHTLSRLGGVLGQVAQPFLAGRSPFHRYGLGVVLGFLPCGLVAAALLAVAATGDPFTAFISMAGFGLATIPALTLAAAFGQISANRWPINMRTIARGVMVFNSASLFAIAGGLIS